MKFILFLLSAVAFAQGPPITINQTQVQGGIANDCLKVNSNKTLGQAACGGGGGGSGTVTSVATSNGLTGGTITTSGTISGINAAANGTTKGVSAFTAADFDASAGVISLDYTNGQKASGSQPGFLSSADWTTFNSKGSGSVTSVATTSPLGGGTITTTGTITCATCTTNASALTANLPMIGGGSNAAAVGTRSGNTTAFVTTTGTQTSGRCVEIDASGNHIASAGACGSGTGTVTVVGSGSLTSTALVTGGGTTTIQTPSATATLSSGGNISTPGTISAGVGAGTAGAVDLGSGTAHTATGVGIQAPTSISTPFMFTLPAAPAAGVMHATNAAPSVVSVSAVSLTADVSGILPSTNGGTGAALNAAAAHSTIISNGASPAVYSAKVIPDCTDTGGNHLNYTQSTDTFSCGTSGGGGSTIVGSSGDYFFPGVASPFGFNAYSNANVGSPSVGVANTETLTHVYIPGAFTPDQITVNITTAGSSGCKFEVGLYDNTKSLVLHSGVVTDATTTKCTTTAPNIITLTSGTSPAAVGLGVTYPAGWYWLASTSNEANIVLAAIWMIAGSGQNLLNGPAHNMGVLTAVGAQATTNGALNSSFTTGSGFLDGTVAFPPLMMLSKQ